MLPLSFFQALLLLVAYGVLGWIIDTSFRTVAARRFEVGGGFPFPKWLPFGTIYAYGAWVLLIMQPLVLPLPMSAQFVLLGALLGAFEYVGGAVSEYLSGRKLWDYSEERFNLNGRTSLIRAAAWGMLALVFLHIIHPWAEQAVRTLVP